MTYLTKINTIRYLLTSFSILFLTTSFQTINAQDSKVSISTGVDLYSTYVWRGVAYSGPSVQPYVELGAGGFSLGAWGSQGIDGITSSDTSTNGFQEMDLYTSYSFDFGLNLGVTDYYYPGSLFFEEDSHAFELNAGYSIENLSLSGNYIFAGGGSAGDDIYFELGYTAGKADLFIGAGDGWHSSAGPTPSDPDNDEFTVVNIGIGTSKDLEITDTFTIPLSGSVIINPDTEQFYITAGVSF